MLTNAAQKGSASSKGVGLIAKTWLSGKQFLWRPVQASQLNA